MALPSLRALLPGRTTALALVVSVGLIALILMAAYTVEVAEQPAREARRQARQREEDTPDFALWIEGREPGMGTTVRPQLPVEMFPSRTPEESDALRAPARQLSERIEARLAGRQEAQEVAGRYACGDLRLRLATGTGFVLWDTQSSRTRYGTATRTPWGVELTCSDPGDIEFRLAQLVLVRGEGYELLLAPQDLQPYFELFGFYAGTRSDPAPWSEGDPAGFLSMDPDSSFLARQEFQPVLLPAPFRSALERDIQVRVLTRGALDAHAATRRTCRLVVDAGEREGLFVGLRFRHTRRDWWSFEAIVLRVEAQRAELLATHTGQEEASVQPGWVLHTRYVW